MIWLLKHHLITQLHTYVYLCVDEFQEEGENEIPAIEASVSSPDSNPEQKTTEDIQIHKLSRILQPTEYRVIGSFIRRDNTPAVDVDHFIRLVPYFRGCQHIEEMMYAENFIRPEVLRTINRFDRFLVTSVHEDELATLLQSNHSF